MRISKSSFLEISSKFSRLFSSSSENRRKPLKIHIALLFSSSFVAFLPAEDNFIRVIEIDDLKVKKRTEGEEAYGEAGFPAWGIPKNAQMRITLTCLKVASAPFLLRGQKAFRSLLKAFFRERQKCVLKRASL